MIFAENRFPPRINGEPSGLAFGKPKGRLRDAVLRTAMAGAGFFGIMLWVWRSSRDDYQ